MTPAPTRDADGDEYWPKLLDWADTAETAADHIAAARGLMTSVSRTAGYVSTPVGVSLAHVHATIALALATAGDDR